MKPPWGFLPDRAAGVGVLFKKVAVFSILRGVDRLFRLYAMICWSWMGLR